MTGVDKPGLRPKFPPPPAYSPRTASRSALETAANVFQILGETPAAMVRTDPPSIRRWTRPEWPLEAPIRAVRPSEDTQEGDPFGVKAWL